MAEMKIDSGLASFSCADRFVRSGYKLGGSFEEHVALLGQVEGVTGLAVDFPSQSGDDPHALRALCARCGLVVGMVEIDMYSSAKWMNGSLTSVSASLRREAIDLCKRGLDFAAEAQAADVQLWLGQDGYEYPFQVDYRRAWDWLAEGLREICTHRTDVKITIEYKLREPRNRCHIGDVGKVLALIAEIGGGPHVGVTLDVGHSLMALENPAESAAMLMRQGRLFHLHFNDNYRDWDHDMIPGSVNVWETVELFYWLDKMEFDGWYGIDIYPYREDGRRALQETVNAMRHFRRLAQRLRGTEIEALQQRNDPLAIQRLLRETLLQEG